MYATIRSYTDPALADMLASNKDEIEAMLDAVPGVQSYVLIRTPEGCTSVTVGDDESATSASAKVAADFLRDHGATAAAPKIASGEVLAHVSAVVPA
jgi:hypothetical protein